jgi:hypothetical protein
MSGGARTAKGVATSIVIATMSICGDGRDLFMCGSFLFKMFSSLDEVKSL